MASSRPARWTCGIAQCTAGLAQEVLERAKRRKVSWPEPVEEDSERLNAAFASVVEFMSRTTKECEKYYSYVPASRCQENEIKHICRYHSRQAAENLLQTLEQEARKASKDLYIEVSPGTYSVTAASEDMVKQTYVVDVNAGQSIDLTFGFLYDYLLFLSPQECWLLVQHSGNLIWKDTLPLDRRVKVLTSFPSKWNLFQLVKVVLLSIKLFSLPTDFVWLKER
ncbi:A-kinase-interacting protein 1 isoform X2 [Gopherus evgoodei]|uniref:A-kinase-interacting protein 1 isoform X2 n=1 Tax=Gopherus evgoodei TaxID=1825980 RepID=UPI0011CF45F1|nr:A-kinase-interacting protein 1 isoform X2 [Gopherus evgoodei]